LSWLGVDISTQELNELYRERYDYGPPEERRFIGIRRAVGSWLRRGESILLDEARGTILDYGAGQGGLLRLLKMRGHDPVATDISDEACANLSAQGFKVIPLDELHSDQHAGTFDTIILSHVLEHLAQPEQELAKLKTLLKPRGRLLIAVPNGGSFYRRAFGRYWNGYHVPFHLFTFREANLRKLLGSSGFIVDRCAFATPYHFPAISFASFLRRKRMDGTSIEKTFVMQNPSRVLLGLVLLLPSLPLSRQKQDCLYLVAHSSEGAL
jgi:2-polyprenyl-3-methyl-5-hydroxy-6-metoxy-1,4-benzoquinol methylase